MQPIHASRTRKMTPSAMRSSLTVVAWSITPGLRNGCLFRPSVQHGATLLPIQSSREKRKLVPMISFLGSKSACRLACSLSMPPGTPCSSIVSPSSATAVKPNAGLCSSPIPAMSFSGRLAFNNSSNRLLIRILRPLRPPLLLALSVFFPPQALFPRIRLISAEDSNLGFSQRPSFQPAGP